MNKTKLENLRMIDPSEVRYGIVSEMRGQFSAQEWSYSKLASIAFTLAIAQDQGYLADCDLRTLLEAEVETDSIRYFVIDQIGAEWACISHLLGKFPTTTLQAFLLYGEQEQRLGGITTTPVAVAKLAANLLRIEPSSKVLDLCCGYGIFFREAYSLCSEAMYAGMDINSDAVGVARLRAFILNEDVTILQTDIFASEDVDKYDRMFCDPPFMSGGKIHAAMQSRYAKQSDRIRPNSQGWAYSVIPRRVLQLNGRAVVVLPIGSTWNMQDADIRADYVKDGSIEAIIELPEKLFDYTSIPSVMVVFSHGNASIRMINARSMCEKGRRNNVLTDKHVQAILDSYTCDSDVSKSISYAEIAAEGFVLSPTRYLERSADLGETIPFGSIIKTITRGAPFRAQELDELVSVEPTEIQYLMLRNIQNGIVDEQLPYLSTIDPRYERYIVNNKALLLSKNGYPFKTAIAEVKKGKTLLANGNLFIIEIDQEQADPYFVKAFLESEKGIATLKSIAVGSALPNISIEALRKMPIPKVALAKQREIAQAYLAKVDEIAVLKRQLGKAVNALGHIFDSLDEQ